MYIAESMCVGIPFFCLVRVAVASLPGPTRRRVGPGNEARVAGELIEKFSTANYQQRGGGQLHASP